ncbi:hypothetical protein A2U01_0068174, partial [Trifolium medium]|nr:hypothetical protein [Trifolium medium]
MSHSHSPNNYEAWVLHLKESTGTG